MEKLMILNNQGANFKATINQGTIEFDFTEVKELITKELVPYETGEVTEFKKGKEELAKLRKVQKNVDDIRVQLKNKWLTNFQPLENELKEIVELLNPAIKNLDTQIKEEDKKEKDLKELEILKLIKDIKNDNMLTYLEVPFNPKWLNKTYKSKDIEAEIWDFINGYIEIEELKANQKTFYRVIEFPELTKEQMEMMKKCFDDNNIKINVLKKELNK